MANLLSFLVMDQQDAARFRTETLGDEHRLEPLLITIGKYKGHYALLRTVMDDPSHSNRHDMFLMLDEIELDADTAFVTPEE